MSGRGSSRKEAGSGWTPARVRHHQPVSDSGSSRACSLTPAMSEARCVLSKRPASCGAGYERARRTAPGKMMSNVQPASRGQPHSPSDVVERVWWAARILGCDRDGAANFEVVLLAVSAAGGPKFWHGPGQGDGLYFSG